MAMPTPMSIPITIMPTAVLPLRFLVQGCGDLGVGFTQRAVENGILGRILSGPIIIGRAGQDCSRRSCSALGIGTAPISASRECSATAKVSVIAARWSASKRTKRLSPR